MDGIDFEIWIFVLHFILKIKWEVSFEDKDETNFSRSELR